MKESEAGGGMHFEAHAEVYDLARPAYPEELWNTLRRLGVMKPGLSVVDLGAGSGQATGPLIAAGLQVTAVEPGPQLAARLLQAHPAATVLRQRAETVVLPDASFDLAVAATSIHWMDLNVVLPRVHSWLRPNGMLAVWRNVFGDPSISTPFRERLGRIEAERDAPPRSGGGEDPEGTSLAITRSGLFDVESMHRYRWSVELDQQQVRRLFTTFSDWSSDEVDRAAQAVAELGGRVTENYTSWLIVARRQDPSAQ